MITLNLYRAISIVLAIGLIGTSGATVYYYRQQGIQEQTILDSVDLQDSYKDQITSLNNQIDALNSQIAQLQALNAQLGGNNAQLISQIQELQTQVDLLEAQVDDLIRTLSLQKSRIIADNAEAQGPYTRPDVAFVSLGQLQYAGYIRISWNGVPLVSYTVQVYDLNITTPVSTSGIYTIPVGANATGQSWFQNYSCTQGPSGSLCPWPVTYSITYWY